MANIKATRAQIFLYLYMAVATIILVLLNKMIVYITINILFLLYMYFVLKIKITNPLLLFVAIFILYQISYLLLSGLGVNVYGYVPLNSNYYLYNWLALLFFVLSYGRISNVEYDRNAISKKIHNVPLFLIFIVLLIICVVSSYQIIKGGYGSKYDLARNATTLIRFGNMAYTALTILPLYFLLNDNVSKKSKYAIATIVLFVMIFGMMTYGERSFLLNYLMVIVFYYFSINKVNARKLLAVVLLGVILMSVSSSMKMLLSNDNYRGSNNTENGLIAGFLSSDFSSAGYNFNYLLNHDDGGVLNGSSYIYDIFSPLDSVLGVDKYSATKWYTNKYWPNRRTGLGFTIIGEGYANFGLFGIILEMFILARLIKYFYVRSNRNYYRYILYVGILTLAMYSCREALGNIISPFVKYHLLLAFAVYAVDKIIDKRVITKENE